MTRFAQRRPFLTLYLLAILSNVGGSAFSFIYNYFVIVKRYLNDEQTHIFWNVAGPVYNVAAYPFCLALMIYFVHPLLRCRRALLAGQPIPPEQLTACQRRLLNLPALQVALNFLGWIPGALFFPLVITTLGGATQAFAIWCQFGISFAVSAIFTTAQTFFLIEGHLMANLYPDFFRDSRPADIQGVLRIPLMTRLLVLWLGVAVMPMVSVLLIALSFRPAHMKHFEMAAATLAVAVLGISVGGFIFFMVGRDLHRWLQRHRTATAEVAHENFDARIPEKRPDEWGLLTDRFNDMAEALGRARTMRETFGQFVGPEVRDEVIDRLHGLEVEVREITVLFADIRGFTRRCVGEKPERVRHLLNRFFTLALCAVRDKGGQFNKFLGDGVMALFGAPQHHDNHADLAIAAAQDMLVRLDELNVELEKEGQAPLHVGIGIHTGPALVGCFGATFIDGQGREHMRREYTAIGETVNFTQRIEQLTKEFPGPILISDRTRARLRNPIGLEDLGAKYLPGSQEPMIVHRVIADILDNTPDTVRMRKAPREM
ncbi:MAG: adenylate/guanylate cyclase domain-containing protein [Planctomycetes bacterium]|nr:adenylate/guanylate cyclase domain-containing protein [Planctomycetota bacterium]